MRYGKLGILYNKNLYFDYYFKSIELDNKKDIRCKNEKFKYKNIIFL